MSDNVTWTTSASSAISNTLATEDINTDSEWGNSTCSNALNSNSSTNWSTITTSTPSISSGYVNVTTTPSIAWGNSNLYVQHDDLNSLLSFLKEGEIEEIFDKIISRDQGDGTIKNIISSTIRNRHFSEDFILKYFDYVHINDIKMQHSQDIRSQNYDRLALLIEASKND